MARQLDYVTVARLEERAARAGAWPAAAGERWYALANVDGVLHAVDNNCPHNGGPLSKGALIGRELECPWHGWRWDVTSGRNCWFGTDWSVSRIPVRVLHGEIQLPDLG